MKLGPGVRINWPKLVDAMERKRKAAKLSIFSASLEAGMTSVGNWHRLLAGQGCHAQTFVRILWWLGATDARPYLVMDLKGDPDT